MKKISIGSWAYTIGPYVETRSSWTTAISIMNATEPERS